MNDRFRLLLHATIGLAIVTYSVAEENLVLAVTALAVWAAAWPVSLGRRGKPLPRVVIGLSVLAATALMLLRLLQAPQDLVTIVSQYLLWMQLIKLYDRVGLRDEAQLLAMSVALVIGACLTSSRLLLGVSLLAYAPMAFWTAAALQVHAGRVRDADRRHAAGAGEARPLPGALSLVAAMRGLRRVVWGSLVVIGTLAVAGFVFLPRSGDSMTTDMLLSASDMTGFNDEVALGEEGLISESEVAVLDVDIERRIDGAPAGVALSRLYLRGAALDEYQDGRWRSSATRRQSTMVLGANEEHHIRSVGDHATVYRLRVQTLLREKPQVFSLLNPALVSFDRSARLQVDPYDLTLVAEADGLPAYTIEARPDAELADRPARPRRMSSLFEEGPIRAEADRLLEELGLERDRAAHFTEDDGRIASAIEAHLRGRCEYTTQMAPPSAGEDPIEMFLFRTQRGHCEYFASSMAAMLRAVGVDARVVTGYVVEAERVAAESFIVRQNDAHAWVEAQVAPGLWRTFDPSPPAQVDALRVRSTGLAAVYLAVKEGLQDLWARRVVGFNRSAQESLLGDWSVPIDEPLRRALQRAGRGLQASPLNAAVSALLSGLIVFAATATTVFAGRAGWRRLVAWLRRRRDLLRAAGADEQARRRLEQAAFYGRALARLRRAGLGRPSWMTPLAHARRLAEVDDALADAVGALAELYYAARYGQRWLTADDRAHADARLAAIDQRLRAVRPRRLRRGGDLT